MACYCGKPSKTKDEIVTSRCTEHLELLAERIAHAGFQVKRIAQETCDHCVLARRLGDVVYCSCMI